MLKGEDSCENDCSKKVEGAGEELSRVTQTRHAPVLVPVLMLGRHVCKRSSLL